ncbi:S26 family signal peptidase [Mycoplasmatota bacterium]|nr:S26 family signal peptidase [Mycoplasmatota bacterium]
MKKTISIIMSIFAGLLIVFIIGSMVSATLSIKNGEPVYFFNYALGVVPTDSMVGDQEDSLDVNDMYLMKDVSIENIDIGDVIVYQGQTSNGSKILIVHRVVDQVNEGFITQGDNESQTDQSGIQDYITADNLVGKFSMKITFLKPISALIQSSVSFIFLGLIVVIFALLVFEIKDIMKHVQEKQKQTLEEEHEKELLTLKEKMKQEILEEIDKDKQ